MSEQGGNGGTVTWRLGVLERGLEREQKVRHDAVKELDDEKADKKQVDRIESKLDGFQRTLIAFSFSAIFAGLMFIIGVLTLVNR